MDKEKLPWRSFADVGGKEEGGPRPIAELWNLQWTPTLYVLDHKGVIRFKGPREKQLDQAVDSLLKEIKTEAN